MWAVFGCIHRSVEWLNKSWTPLCFNGTIIMFYINQTLKQKLDFFCFLKMYKTHFFLITCLSLEEESDKGKLGLLYQKWKDNQYAQTHSGLTWSPQYTPSIYIKSGIQLPGMTLWLPFWQSQRKWQVLAASPFRPGHCGQTQVLLSKWSQLTPEGQRCRWWTALYFFCLTQSNNNSIKV